MGYSAQYLTDGEWEELHKAFQMHGNGPAFWEVYQRLHTVAQKRTGDSCIRVANEMARVAQKIGVTREALFV